jgi:hypothetical protein
MWASQTREQATICAMATTSALRALLAAEARIDGVLSRCHA